MDNNYPKYIVDFYKFEENCNEVQQAFDREWNANTIYGYSVKTNRNQELIKFAYNNAWYIEMVSPDEYEYCRNLGIEPDRMILNGPCKEKLIEQEKLEVEYINLDNLDEVYVYCKSGVNSRVGLRINFDMEQMCPGETTAGDEVSRFGFDSEGDELLQAVDILKKHGHENIGVHLHTSSVTRSTDFFAALAQKTVLLKEKLNINFDYIDIGGGFFGGQKIVGKPLMDDYAKTICNILKEAFSPCQTTLILEPGASVIATCVSYQTAVINVRDIRGTKIITLDGTLLHINPFMVKRSQPYIVMNNLENREIIEKQIICGSTCMEKDRFDLVENKSEIKKGDILCFHNVGAYTMEFNSSFIFNPPKVEYVR